MKNTIGFLSAFLVLLGVLAAQGAAKTYDWTGAAGDNILNTAGNWSPERTTPAPSSDIVRYFTDAGSSETVTLDADFLAQFITFTNVTDAAGRHVIDLKGHQLNANNSGTTYFRSTVPLALTNGEFRTSKVYYGRPDGRVVDVFLRNVIANAGGLTEANSHFDPIRMRLQDSVSTNFPCYAIGSNAEFTFDNTPYYIAKQHMYPVNGATNFTLRFVNGSTFETYSGSYGFGNSDKRYHRSRVTFESGSVLKRFMKFCNSPASTDNLIAFSNAVFNSYFNVNGTNNVIEFIDTDWTYTPGSGTFPTLYGFGNRARIGGSSNLVKLTYLDVFGTSNTVEFCDNTVYSNSTSTAVRFREGASGGSLVIGTNCVVRLSSFANNANKNTHPYASVRVGKGSLLLATGRGDVDAGAFGGTDTHFILDGGVFKDGVGSNNPRVFRAGLTMEFIGDTAAFENGYGDLTGIVYFGQQPDGFTDLKSKIRFAPGPNGFNGRPPFRSRHYGTSTIEDDVQIEVDLRDYLPACGGGWKRLPLFNGDPAVWSHFDLDKMNENLKVVTGNRLVRDAKLVYNKDLNAIVLEFKPVLGLMILVR